MIRTKSPQEYYNLIDPPLPILISDDVIFEEYLFFDSYIGGVHLDHNNSRIFISAGLLSLVYVYDFNFNTLYILELCDPKGKYIEPLGVSTMENGEIIIGAWGSYVFHFSNKGFTNKPALKLIDIDKNNYVRQIKAINNEWIIAGALNGAIFVIKKDFSLVKNLTADFTSPLLGTFNVISVSPVNSIICGGTESLNNAGHVFIIYRDFSVNWWHLDGTCSAVAFKDDGQLFVGTSKGSLFYFELNNGIFKLIANLGFSIVASADRFINELMILGDGKGNVYSLNTKKGILKKIAYIGSHINSIDIEKKTKKIIIGTDEGTVLVISLHSFQDRNRVLYESKIDWFKHKCRINNINKYLRELENCYWIYSKEKVHEILHRDRDYFDDEFIEALLMRLTIKVKKGEPEKLSEIIIKLFADCTIQLPETNTLNKQFCEKIRNEFAEIRTLDINKNFDKRENYLFLKNSGIQVKEIKYKSDDFWTDSKVKKEINFDKGMPEELDDSLKEKYPYYSYFVFRHRVQALETLWNKNPVLETSQQLAATIVNTYNHLLHHAVNLPEAFFINIGFEASERSRSRILIEKFENSIASINQGIGNTRFPSHLAIRRVKEYLSNDELILQFHSFDKRIYLFIIDTLEVKCTNYDYSFNTNKLESILNLINKIDFKKYAKVLVSIAPDLLAEKKLNIINEFFIKNVPSSYILSPSLTLAFALHQANKNDNDGNILIISDPTKDLGKVARIETEFISQFFNKVFLLEGTNASWSNIERMICSYEFEAIHFICHGSDFDEEQNMNFLRLSNNECLYPHQISQLNLLGVNITLSTCFSGKIVNRIPGEIEGIIEGFLIAGANRILATTNEIDSIDSYNFMKSFYSKWKMSRQNIFSAYKETCIENNFFNYSLYGSIIK